MNSPVNSIKISINKDQHRFITFALQIVCIKNLRKTETLVMAVMNVHSEKYKSFDGVAISYRHRKSWEFWSKT